MKFSTIKHCLACFSKPRIFNVDINNKDMKIFQIEQKKNRHKVIGWAKKKFPRGVIDDFEVKDKDKFVEVLGEALASNTARKIKGSVVALSIPENKVFLRILDIPVMTEKEAAEAIKWEVEGNIPISIDEVYYDWQIVKKEGKKMKVLIAASPRRIIDSLIEAFEHADLRVCILEADSIAVERSLLPQNENDPILVVDIGIEGTGYFVFYNGYPVFSSSGYISGQMFTDAVAKYYEIEWDKAEHYKTKVGLGSNRKEREEALCFYSPLLTTLIQEIEKTINFYNENLSGNSKKEVRKVILCGGGSNFKGLLPYLAIHLKRQVAQGNPWENIKLAKEIPPISKEEAQSYITVIGLALKSSNYGNQY
ncbi:MAG: type IV pilus assembly protein PilM [Patescibacteria group bacterium]|nr:type IV pilus assembly protein PilM [Patescibacteria group bacterium]